MFYSSLWWFMKANMQGAFVELVQKTQRQRGFGDYYGFLLVAQGAGEFMVEHGVKEWDIAALKVIVEEAGGRFSDWDGSPTTKNPHCLASNGNIYVTDPGHKKVWLITPDGRKRVVDEGPDADRGRSRLRRAEAGARVVGDRGGRRRVRAVPVERAGSGCSPLHVLR
jgi:hypothetical protein